MKDNTQNTAMPQGQHTTPDLTDCEPTLWVFGYGSLLWKPDFRYRSKHVGYIDGYTRRFYQGNETFRGKPGQPGRVANLVEQDGSQAWGVAYEIRGEEEVANVLQALYTRETASGGYVTLMTTFYPRDHQQSDIEQQQSARSRQHSVTKHQHFGTNHQHSDTHHQHPDTNHQHFGTNHQHSDTHHQHPDTNHQHPEPNHQHSDTNHQHPDTNYQHFGTNLKHSDITSSKDKRHGQSLISNSSDNRPSSPIDIKKSLNGRMKRFVYSLDSNSDQSSNFDSDEESDIPEDMSLGSLSDKYGSVLSDYDCNIESSGLLVSNTERGNEESLFEEYDASDQNRLVITEDDFVYDSDEFDMPRENAQLAPLECEDAFQQNESEYSHIKILPVQRPSVKFDVPTSSPIQVLTYTVTPDNDMYLGPDDVTSMAKQIARASGSAGSNVEYVTKIADFVRSSIPEDNDTHLFDLDMMVKEEVHKLTSGQVLL